MLYLITHNVRYTNKTTYLTNFYWICFNIYSNIFKCVTSHLIFKLLHKKRAKSLSDKAQIQIHEILTLNLMLFLPTIASFMPMYFLYVTVLYLWSISFVCLSPTNFSLSIELYTFLTVYKCVWYSIALCLCTKYIQSLVYETFSEILQTSPYF